MRFESFLWALIASLLIVSSVVEPGTAPLAEDAQFHAADGGNEIPPPTTKP